MLDSRGRQHEMGLYYELTSLGKIVAGAHERKRLQPSSKAPSDQVFILLELSSREPAEEERFLHKMEELGYSEERVRDILDILEGVGLVEEV